MTVGCGFRLPITPTAPTLNALSVISPGPELDLSWTLGTGTHQIQVWRGTDGVTFAQIATLGVVTSYNDTSLQSGQVYYYFLVAVSIDGLTAQSNTQHATTAAGLLPDADTYEGYSLGAFPAPSSGPTWLQADNSAGGHNTGVVAANPSPALDSTGAQVLYQGLARTSVLWRANTASPLGILYPADAIVQVYTDAGGSTSLGTDGAGVIFRASGVVAGGNLSTLNGYLAATSYHGSSEGGICLYKIVNGALTLLGSVVNSPYIGGGVAHVPIGFAQSNILKAGLWLPGTNQYLTSGGSWTSTPTYAITLTDNTYSAGGFAGVYSTAGGQTYFDDWSIIGAAADITPPTCTLTSPASNQSYSGTVTLTATAADNAGGSGMQRVDFYVDGILVASIAAPGPYTSNLGITGYANGSHLVVAKAYDVAGNEGDSTTVTFIVTGNTRPTAPTWPTPLASCNFETAAYDGFPNGGPGGNLTSGSTMDTASAAIMPNVSYCNCNTKILAALRTAVPTGLYTVYSNISQIYLQLLLDWLNWADANSHSREDGFIHVSVLTSFSQTSSSNAQAAKTPWQLYSTADNVDRITSGFSDNAPVFPGTSGQKQMIGYPDPFRSIQTVGTAAPAGGWTYTLQYCNSVDGSGNPTNDTTAWHTLTTLTDGTSGFTVDGVIDFDPPSDWVACKGASQPNGNRGVGDANGMSGGFGDGSTFRYFYIRVKVTGTGTAPTMTGVRMADYTAQGSGVSGAVPAYDYVLDAKYGSKGFLKKSEYTDGTRASGKDAWFAYQGRGPSSYGYGRVATNPTNTNFQAWCIDYHNRLLANAGGGDYNGVDMDNCAGKVTDTPANSIENLSATAYRDGVATCCKLIWLNAGTYRGVQRFVNCNSSNNVLNGAGSNNLAIGFVKICPSIATESTFHTFTMTWGTYQGICDGINAVAAAASPPPMIHLDSDSAGYPAGSFASAAAAQADAQSAYNLLCCYYTVQQQNMFFPMYSGDGITNPFTYHYSGSLLANIGTPVDAAIISTTTPWQTGSDSTGGYSAYTFNIYKRQFTGPGGGNQAVVLYRPCSQLNSSTPGPYASGGVSQSLANLIAGVTTYYPLTPGDVHTGAGITSISLTNGDGAILFTSPV